MSIKIGILGYGNLAKGVESAIMQNEDLELAAVFTRRDPASVSIRTAGVPVLSQDAAADMKDKIDVLVICGGSATDLPIQTPKYAEMFNVVDSFDTHANIPTHFANVDAAAKKGGHVGLISCGWDPGMFSLNRLYMNCILPEGKDYTFWGKGVSQGHSDAVRRIDGVLDARQYTIPVDAAVESVRRGENRNIFPYQENSDAIFNSAHIFELPVLKYYAEPLLRRIAPNSPAYTEATRILKFLSYIVELSPQEIAAIPPTSILREFIAGQTL
jgi:diaminopimelate dehydrogenase